MRTSAELCSLADKNIELLWASSREVLNVIQAQEAGCQIITVTSDIIKKLSMLNKDLTQLSLETVRMFKKDADSAGFQL
jgi:transaldolase